MSDNAAATETPSQPAPPVFDPDPELIAHLEGNSFALRAYRRRAEELRREAQEGGLADG